MAGVRGPRIAVGPRGPMRATERLRLGGRHGLRLRDGVPRTRRSPVERLRRTIRPVL